MLQAWCCIRHVAVQSGHGQGPLIVARDIAHAKISEIFEQTGKLPEYVKVRANVIELLQLARGPSHLLRGAGQAAGRDGKA